MSWKFPKLPRFPRFTKLSKTPKFFRRFRTPTGVDAAESSPTSTLSSSSSNESTASLTATEETSPAKTLPTRFHPSSTRKAINRFHQWRLHNRYYIFSGRTTKKTFEDSQFATKWRGQIEKMMKKLYRNRWTMFHPKNPEMKRFCRGNVLEIYHEGNSAFSGMWNDIACAEKSILMEAYTIKPDFVGIKTLELLIAKKIMGVDVRLVLDFFGCWDLFRSKEFRVVESSGIKVELYNPWTNWGRMTPKIRNHRKLLVVDDIIGYCGGMNIANEYCGSDVGGSGFFRDTMMRLQGPIVGSLKQIFEETEAEAKKHRDLYEKNSEEYELEDGGQSKVETVQTEVYKPPLMIQLPPPPWRQRVTKAISDGVLARALVSNTNNKEIQRMIRKTLTSAQQYCYITTPYLLPPPRLAESLIRAAYAGVDVRILTSGKSDVPIVRFACRYLYRLLLSNGIRIYELTEHALHAKTITIDGSLNIVGSFNIDIWSNRNAEIAVAAIDNSIGEGLRQQFLKDLKGSREVHLLDDHPNNAPLLTRISQALVYYFFAVIS